VKPIIDPFTGTGGFIVGSPPYQPFLLTELIENNFSFIVQLKEKLLFLGA
jgi:hypothetical protein